MASQEAFLHRVADATRLAEMYKAMGVEGVARPHGLELEVDPRLGAGVDNPRHGGARLANFVAVLAGDALRVRALAHLGRARVQFVGAPHDFDLVAVFELRQRALELALADVAPRAHDVGPDLGLHNVLAITKPMATPMKKMKAMAMSA
jgi:hypothetical protein